jgi:hypothetical protein
MHFRQPVFEESIQGEKNKLELKYTRPQTYVVERKCGKYWRVKEKVNL